MATTLRVQDNAAEVEISRYLDMYFYPFYTTNYVRYADRETQMSGVDVKFDYGGMVNLLVDEKALTHYINSDLPTFAFELDFISNNQVIPGWFYDDGKVTEYYLMSWITAKNDTKLKAEEIIKLDTLLVSRKKIIEFVASYGATKDKVLLVARNLRQKKNYGVTHKDLSKRPFYFVFSNQLGEQPINLVIRKEKLIEIAIQRFEILPR